MCSIYRNWLYTAHVEVLWSTERSTTFFLDRKSYCSSIFNNWRLLIRFKYNKVFCGMPGMPQGFAFAHFHLPVQLQQRSTNLIVCFRSSVQLQQRFTNLFVCLQQKFTNLIVRFRSSDYLLIWLVPVFCWVTVVALTYSST